MTRSKDCDAYDDDDDGGGGEERWRGGVLDDTEGDELDVEDDEEVDDALC